MRLSVYLLVFVLLSSVEWVACKTAKHSNLRHSTKGGRLLQQQQGGARQYSLWSSQQIHSTLLTWKTKYPNLVRITTAQDEFNLPRAGSDGDCPFDDGGVGCLNYILTIQDYVVHPTGSDSSNRLPEVLWSGELHGNERVGPTAVMEAAFLLLEAASCEAALDYDSSLHASCSASLQSQYGISSIQQQWLARLVSTRRIIIIPTANALGYYRNSRTENGIDVNRDFPFDYSAGEASNCMQTIGGRTLNEIFRQSLIQMALTFHGGIELIGYEWGADSYAGVLSPDDEAQEQLASSLSQYGGAFGSTPQYPIGPMDRTVYTVKGGMEDWAYGGSWLGEMVVQCNPVTFGGYPAEKTIYNDSMLRAFNLLVETSDDKIPADNTLGTSHQVLDASSSGNGHVSRNIRLAIMSADIVEPYLRVTAVDNLALSTSDVVPLTERNCPRMNAVRVPQSLSSVTIEWTVGGALEIDETQLYYGNWNSVLGVDCYSQPPASVVSNMAMGTMLTSATGTGYFSKFGVSPTSGSGDSPLGPVFRATIDLSSFALGDKVIVLARAKVDQSWTQQPSGIAPQVAPQSHIVNVRTDSSWFHTNNGKIIQGHDSWLSVIPLTLVISDSTTLVDASNTFTETTEAPTLAPTLAPTPLATTSPPTTARPTTSPPTTSLPTTVPTKTPVQATPSPVMVDSGTPAPVASTPSPNTVAPTSSPVSSTQSPTESASTESTPAPQQDDSSLTPAPTIGPTLDLPLPTPSDLRDDETKSASIDATSGALAAYSSLGTVSIAWLIFLLM